MKLSSRKQLLKEADAELKRIQSGLTEINVPKKKDLIEVLLWTSRMLNTMRPKHYNEIKQLQYAVSNVLTWLENNHKWEDISEGEKNAVKLAVGKAVWAYNDMQSSYNLAKSIKANLK